VIVPKKFKKGVRFSAETATMTSQAEGPPFHLVVSLSGLKPIEDLCKSIQIRQTEQRIGCFGFLVDAEWRGNCSIYSLPSTYTEKPGTGIFREYNAHKRLPLPPACHSFTLA
jgi:hypothetical protein